MDLEYESNYHKIERINWWPRSRRHIILYYLKSLQARRILDVGCTSGATIEALKAHGFSDVYGIDISKKAIAECRKKELNAFVQPAEKTCFENGFFDTIIASDILEHTLNDGKVLKEWHRILKPGGHIILFVPAFMHLWSSHDEILHHTKRYRLPEIVKLAQKCNFVIKEETYWNFALYFPRLAANMYKNLFHVRSANIDSGNAFTNWLLYEWLCLENFLIILGIRFPFGVSCFAVLKKKNKNH